MENEKLGIGLVGAGLIGTLHASNLALIIKELELPAALVHVADREMERAERFKQTFGFCRASRDAGAVIMDPEVDAVLICTWTSEHPPLVLSAAENGKRVFCEKPLAKDLTAAREMLAAVNSSGVTHQAGLVLRTAPVWTVLREEARSSENGFPITMVFRDDQCFPIKGAHPSEWRKDCERAGHGALIEHSIHDLDLMEWVFGPIASVSAATAERFGHKDIEDLARVSLEFDSGMTGTLVSVWHDVLNRHSDRRMEVFHEKSFIATESEFTGPLWTMRGDGPMSGMTEEEVNKRFFELCGIEDPAMKRISKRFGALEMINFLLSVMEGKAARPGFDQAVRAHELVEACYQSAGEGKAVILNNDRLPGKEAAQ